VKREAIALAASLSLAAAAPPAAHAQSVSGRAQGAPREQIGIAIGSRPYAGGVEDLEGHDVNLSDYLGHGPVLLEFWAQWCENCKALLPSMEEAHRRYGKRVRFLAIAVGVGQSPRTIKRHLRQHPAPYPTLWDGEGNAVRAFRTPTTSYVVILDAKGRVAYTGVGRDQDIVGAVRGVLEAG